jgi:hypothetical protein
MNNFKDAIGKSTSDFWAGSAVRQSTAVPYNPNMHVLTYNLLIFWINVLCNESCDTVMKFRCVRVETISSRYVSGNIT